MYAYEFIDIIISANDIKGDRSEVAKKVAEILGQKPDILFKFIQFVIEDGETVEQIKKLLK